MPAHAGIQVTDSVRHTLENGIQVKGMGMDPSAFAGMTDRSHIPHDARRMPPSMIAVPCCQ
jgi:hypothetical protein